ncbi:ATP-dependent helicase [Aestuariibacter sp. AA17]|uniref:DNA 3'-5' helicase n=1 Tax=Fluctibacter corallii TaxID=2984329 RepID=A0ABT3AAP0_9ALTE|nr:ATP-dependent helicase [Aestuariibacter sp. AA17]MCV2885738.1 ATP-dependent helicase [Aestuariibacter sp. AA17]
MAKRLTREQKAVVHHLDGHALVKAVPGSGKTTTLVKRVERLVKSGVSKRAILVLMYNKSAQVSFAEKLKIALDSDVIPEVRTFHSFALQVIKVAENRKLIEKRTLLTPADPKHVNMVKQAYRNGFSHSDTYIPQDDIEELELFITRNRAEGIVPSDISSDPSLNETKPEFLRAYSWYCDTLDENKLRTFDDCLIEAVKILNECPQILGTFRQIIVDEYQDVNFIQNELVKRVATSGVSVMAVGDVNQCIYEWRGARPDFIAGIFEKHYINTKVFNLSCTFRFGHKLALMSNSVIRRNSVKQSSLCISHPSATNTEIQIYHEDDMQSALRELANQDGSCAILSRTKASLAETELALRMNRIAYSYLNGDSPLYTRAEIGMLAIYFSIGMFGDLQILNGNPQRQTLVFGFLKNAGFKWEKGQLQEARQVLMHPDSDLWNTLYSLLGQSEFRRQRVDELSALKNKYDENTNASTMFSDLKNLGLFDSIGFGGVSRIGSNDQKRGTFRIEQLLLTSHLSGLEFLNLILEPPEPVSTAEFVLSTLHTSKGLEWDHVVMVGLNEKDYPGIAKNDADIVLPKELTTDSELEENRRLFYVGMTRAMRSVTFIVPEDEGLKKWLANAWDSTPKLTSVATRFVYETGLTAAIRTGDAIYANSIDALSPKLNKLHKWYIKEFKKLRI